MHRDQFNISQDTRKALGDDLIDSVISRFHAPGECAVCHRPLGTEGRFSLHVTDNASLVTVRPVHAPCYSPIHVHAASGHISADSYRTLPVVMPVTRDVPGSPEGETLGQPVLFVNPALDQETLLRPQGAERPIDPTADTLRETGWHVPGEPEWTDGSAGEVRHSGTDLSLHSIFGTWTADVPPEFTQTMNEHWDGDCFAALVRSRLVDELVTVDDIGGWLGARAVAGDLWIGRFTATTD